MFKSKAKPFLTPESMDSLTHLIVFKDILTKIKYTVDQLSINWSYVGYTSASLSIITSCAKYKSIILDLNS